MSIIFFMLPLKYILIKGIIITVNMTYFITGALKAFTGRIRSYGNI
jgi:hypothetical protein